MKKIEQTTALESHGGCIAAVGFEVDDDWGWSLRVSDGGADVELADYEVGGIAGLDKIIATLHELRAHAVTKEAQGK